MASLFIISGDQKGDYYPLGVRTNVVGRDEALPIQVLDDSVSRKHLQIRYDKQQDEYLALDMKSKHGVFINDRRIVEETVLADGDEILIGQTTLLFTKKDFEDWESALSHFKKVGERMRPTHIQ
ncbi:MAG: FHA domain-containing protein [Chloroflexi bacterium]|nr:FHA domain-containing protein [Chloroflexota bacterium]MBL7189490.1 FHA domain-containing protein [Phycisphaerae bacterium]